MNLNDRLDKFRADEAIERAEWELKNNRREPEWVWDNEIRPTMKAASVDNYKQWLKGYMENGGEPTNSYDYPFGRWDWFVAVTDFRLVKLCGALSKNIIVPEHVKFLGGDKGHCGLYFMDGFTVEGHSVPVFSDIIF